MCVCLCNCSQVITGGRYEIVVFYTSEARATFSLSVGKFTDIQAEAAPSVTRQLPASVSVTSVARSISRWCRQCTAGHKLL